MKVIDYILITAGLLIAGIFAYGYYTGKQNEKAEFEWRQLIYEKQQERQEIQDRRNLFEGEAREIEGKLNTSTAEHKQRSNEIQNSNYGNDTSIARKLLNRNSTK